MLNAGSITWREAQKDVNNSKIRKENEAEFSHNFFVLFLTYSFNSNDFLFLCMDVIVSWQLKEIYDLINLDMVRTDYNR